MKSSYVEIFGENKTIRDWSKDKRCVVDYTTLKSRLKKKQNPEMALTTPHKRAGSNDVCVGDVLHDRLEVLEKYVNKHYTQNATYVKVQCNCDKQTVFDIKLNAITSGNTRSCGCLQSEVQRKRAIERNYKHGKADLSNNRLYRIWCGMKSRCYTIKARGYKNYGGRGIKVCDDWKDFNVFEKWALTNGYQDNLTIERKRVNEDYCPENCCWITIEKQQSNKTTNVFITAWGETKTLNEWSRDNRCKIHRGMVKYRIDNGWSPENAISIPPLKKNRWAGEPKC